uniref:Mitochondrial import inner membrane translocase subunit TIM50 n=1 Tax=Ornithorhynchus anatinus TaxID=9258 RepID=A0A6I8NEE6_ORNAN
MMRTQCLLGLRTFVAFAAKFWSFCLYLLRRQVRTVIQYQTVRYDVLPLSLVSRNRLGQVKRKILVLDLDETLIHSHHDGVLRPTVRPGTPPDFILKVSQWYELVVFTASMEIYGSAVADRLDNSRSILKRRYYRQVSCGEAGPGAAARGTTVTGISVANRLGLRPLPALHFGVGQLHQGPVGGPQRPLQYRHPGQLPRGLQESPRQRHPNQVLVQRPQRHRAPEPAPHARCPQVHRRRPLRLEPEPTPAPTVVTDAPPAPSPLGGLRSDEKRRETAEWGPAPSPSRSDS